VRPHACSAGGVRFAGGSIGVQRWTAPQGSCVWAALMAILGRFQWRIDRKTRDGAVAGSWEEGFLLRRRGESQGKTWVDVNLVMRAG